MNDAAETEDETGTGDPSSETTSRDVTRPRASKWSMIRCQVWVEPGS